MNTEDVLTELRMACFCAGSQLQWAMKHQIAPQTVNSVIRRAMKPTPAILKALGLCVVVSYERDVKEEGT